MSFQRTTITVALVTLIIIFIMIIIVIKRDTKEKTWPPMISQCPDYFDVVGENQCENRKYLGNSGDGCLGRINFSDPKYRGHEGLKEKKEWAKGCGVTWDGITNNVDIE